jgi:hypothetical protein
MKLGRRLAAFPGSGKANFLHQLLPKLANGWFTLGMILAAVLLAAVAAAAAAGGSVQRRGAVRVATATVTIVQAERITPVVVAQRAPKQDRQISVREGKPMVEFH